MCLARRPEPPSAQVVSCPACTMGSPGERCSSCQTRSPPGKACVPTGREAQVRSLEGPRQRSANPPARRQRRPKGTARRCADCTGRPLYILDFLRVFYGAQGLLKILPWETCFHLFYMYDSTTPKRQCREATGRHKQYQDRETRRQSLPTKFENRKRMGWRHSFPELCENK